MTALLRSHISALWNEKSTIGSCGAKLLEQAHEAGLLSDEHFTVDGTRIEDWERHWMLSALERIASMMDAEHLDAAPTLETGPVAQPAQEAPAPGGLDPKGEQPRRAQSIFFIALSPNARPNRRIRPR